MWDKNIDKIEHVDKMQHMKRIEARVLTAEEVQRLDQIHTTILAHLKAQTWLSATEANEIGWIDPLLFWRVDRYIESLQAVQDSKNYTSPVYNACLVYRRESLVQLAAAISKVIEPIGF
jgi:hypothetical protein